MESVKEVFSFGSRILFFPLWFWLRSKVELEMEVGF